MDRFGLMALVTTTETPGVETSGYEGKPVNEI